MKKRAPIAVVGMAGVFPKAADLNIFWHNIINKIDSSSDVLKDRWIVEPDLMYNPDPMPDKALSKRSCLIDADTLQSIKSDHTGININKDLLKDLDPLYHLVLHAGKEALSDCATSSLNKERIGIGKATKTSPESWLYMQAKLDIWLAEQKPTEVVELREARAA